MKERGKDTEGEGDKERERERERERKRCRKTPHQVESGSNIVET